MGLVTHLHKDFVRAAVVHPTDLNIFVDLSPGIEIAARATQSAEVIVVTTYHALMDLDGQAVTTTS